MPTLGWAITVLTYPYNELYKRYGLDTVMFIRTIRTFLYLVLFYSVYGIVVLFPLHATGHNHNKSEGSKTYTCGMLILTISNINRDTEMNRMYCHAIGLILTTVVTLCALSMNYRFFAHYAKKDTQCSAPSNYTCMIKHVRHTLSDEEVDARVTSLFAEVVHVTRVPHAPMLERAHKRYASFALRQEKAKFQEDKTKKEQYTRAIADTVIPRQLACLCCPFKKERAVEYFGDHMDKTAAEISEMQEKAGNLKKASTVFVTFNTARAALAAAFVRISWRPSKWTISRAPHPKDLNWKHLDMAWKTRAIRRALILSFCVVLVFLWMIPIAFASTLFTLNDLAEISWLSWIARIVNGMGTTVAGFVSGMLPALIVIAAFAILEPLLIFLAGQMGYVTFSEAKATAHHLYFVFVIVNVLLVSAIATTFFGFIDQIWELAQKPFDVVLILAKALPAQNNYFINYVITGTISCTLQLIRPVPLFMWFIKYHFVAKTPREKELVCVVPGEFDYVFHYGWYTLIWVITLIFTPLAPAILPFSAFYFLTAVTTNSYNLIYVTPVLKDGRANMWNNVYIHISVGLVLTQLTLIGIFALNVFIGGIVIGAVTCVCTVVFLFFLRNSYYGLCTNGALIGSTHSTPLDKLPTEVRKAIVHAYTPPTLVAVDVTFPPPISDSEKEDSYSSSPLSVTTDALSPVVSPSSGHDEEQEKEKEKEQEEHEEEKQQAELNEVEQESSSDAENEGRADKVE
eukprot:TRINITY_DN1271_c0_g1_i4.p1 TRINITY_DN1271_c0_g1~~TRINITY_DN1271_c0_g1_i4.p1  ORF type:complete len:855 (+),score=191.96 TRINITY_DN1271_c0_g1_i4:344-2566(+)